jgi:tetratricopeptide (TPR) repeat protein
MSVTAVSPHRGLTVDPKIMYQPGANSGEPRAADPPARTTADDQVVVGDIPAQRPGLQPRPVLLAQLNRPGQEPPAVVLTGTWGVGKTELAAAYARARLAGGWRMIAWVNAGGRESLLTGLAAVAHAAALPDGDAEPGAAGAGHAVRRWLEADGSRCLLVFDDAEDPDLLRPFVPATGAARVLITAARAPVAELGPSVPVGVFGAEEAVALLDGRTGLADQAGAAAVAAEVGYLPLALDQAAAVIAGQHLGYAAYLAELRARPAEDDPAGPEQEQLEPPGQAGAVLLSLRAARAADPLGVSSAVMEVMAVLAPAAVRRDLLRAAGQAGTLLGGGRRVVASMVDQALKRLNERSLLGFSLDGQVVTVHGEVARLVRAGLARQGRLATVCRAAASALHDQIDPGDGTPPATAVAEPLTANLERLLGPDHPDTLHARNSLARVYRETGRLADAVPLLERNLEAWERLLGPDYPSTIASRNNLASAYRAVGRPAEAVPLFQQNVDACEQLLGADHAKTRASRHHLEQAREEVAQAQRAGHSWPEPD